MSRLLIGRFALLLFSISAVAAAQSDPLRATFLGVEQSGSPAARYRATPRRRPMVVDEWPMRCSLGRLACAAADERVVCDDDSGARG